MLCFSEQIHSPLSIGVHKQPDQYSRHSHENWVMVHTLQPCGSKRERWSHCHRTRDRAGLHHCPRTWWQHSPGRRGCGFGSPAACRVTWASPVIGGFPTNVSYRLGHCPHSGASLPLPSLWMARKPVPTKQKGKCSWCMGNVGCLHGTWSQVLLTGKTQSPPGERGRLTWVRTACSSISVHPLLDAKHSNQATHFPGVLLQHVFNRGKGRRANARTHLANGG